MTTVNATFSMAPALLPAGKIAGGIRLVLFSEDNTYQTIGTDAGATILSVLPGSYTVQAQRLTSDGQQSIGAMFTGSVDVPAGSDTTTVPVDVAFSFS